MNAPATPKYAAYICSGCGIGDKLDVPTLEKIAQKEDPWRGRGFLRGWPRG